jgi:molecular chaperone GrpE
MGDENKTAEQEPLEPSQVENKVNEVNKEIEQLTKQLEQEKEAKLMARADLDNYKKRVQKEREEMTFLGNATILSIVLEILEDLERGLADLKEIPVGLSMIKDKVNNLLAEQDIVELPIKEGDDFDPSKMEAIGTITVNEPEKDKKVIHVDRKAYIIKSKDMLIRTARVIVGKKG